jgi:hypothetical protein
MDPKVTPAHEANLVPTERGLLKSSSAAGIVPEWRPSTVRSTLSLPDIKSVDRKVAAYGEIWEGQTKRVEKSKQSQDKLTDRRKYEATVVAKTAVRGHQRTARARAHLGTPLPAGLTLVDMDTFNTSNREAHNELHADCLRRELRAAKLEKAQREATMAADRAEHLRAVKVEERCRVQWKMMQEETYWKHRRRVEAYRQREYASLESHHIDRWEHKALRESLRQAQQQKNTESVAARRRQKEEAEKELKEQKAKEAANREANAQAKEAAKAAAKAHVEREHAVDYVRRLEKVT